MTHPTQPVSIRSPLFMGFAALCFLVFAIGGWSISTNISGAVVASGAVRVEGPTRVISHERGGIIAEVMVENGSPVKSGDVLLVLEDTLLQAKLEGVQDRLFETLSQEARLKAQASNSPELLPSDRLLELLNEFPRIADRLDRHQNQLSIARQSLRLRADQQTKIIAQIREQIGGARIKLNSIVAEIKIIEQEMVNAQDLLGRQLERMSTVSRLERDLALKRGELGVAKANIAEKEQRILELGMVIRTLEEKFWQEALEMLSKVESEKARLVVERAELLGQLQKLVVRAPVEGIIHESTIAGVGSLVVANLPILGIVPTTEVALAHVQVRASDIDQVYLGQQAHIRLKSYNARSMPMIFGTVHRIGADTVLDSKTKQPVYEIQIVLPTEELEEIQQVELVNGMQLSAFLATAEQTPLQYISRPIVDFFSMSFKDT